MSHSPHQHPCTPACRLLLVNLIVLGGLFSWWIFSTLPAHAASFQTLSSQGKANSKHQTKPLPAPGVLQCLNVLLTLNNDRAAHLQVTIGVDNACPADVTPPINWDINSQLTCGDQTIAGPQDEGAWVTPLVQNHNYTIVNEGFNITCIIDDVPADWVITMNATVDGDIVYGEYDIASGTKEMSLGG